MNFRRSLGAAAVALAVAAPAAHAADSVVASTARFTPLAADAGDLLYSAWDGTGYRLTLIEDGVTTTLPIAASNIQFQADLGPGPDGHEVAVYPRCETATTGCDLYEYDLTTSKETALTSANSPTADEVAGAIWRDQLVFARVYPHQGAAATRIIYTRSLSGHAPSKRIADKFATSLDLRGTLAPFEDSLEFTNEPWLAVTNGGAPKRLARVPGGGGSVNYLDALNPTAYGNSIYWMLSSGGDDNFSEFHRYNRSRKRDERVATRIPGRASGFAYDAGTQYYAIPTPVPGISCSETQDCPTAIHRVTGALSYEKAPPIRNGD